MHAPELNWEHSKREKRNRNLIWTSFSVKLSIRWKGSKCEMNFGEILSLSSKYSYPHPCPPAAVSLCAKSLQSCLTATLWIMAHQAPLSMAFSRQEYWSGLLFPPPGDHPNPEIKPASLTSPHWQAGSLPLMPPGKSQELWSWYNQHCDLQYFAVQTLVFLCVMKEYPIFQSSIHWCVLIHSFRY